MLKDSLRIGQLPYGDTEVERTYCNMKMIYTICIILVSCCSISGQSLLPDLLKLFPKAELPYSPPEDYPDFDPDYPDDSMPKAFSSEKIPDEMVKQLLDPYADEGATFVYPVHQINLDKYIGLVVYSYQFNRMDGTFMPFYYLYIIDDNGQLIESVMELATQFSRMSMSSLDVYESTKVNSEIYINEYDTSKILLKNTSSFSQSKSDEYGQRKLEENDFFYLLGADGIWKNVTNKLED